MNESGARGRRRERPSVCVLVTGQTAPNVEWNGFDVVLTTPDTCTRSSQRCGRRELPGEELARDCAADDFCTKALAPSALVVAFDALLKRRLPSP